MEKLPSKYSVVFAIAALVFASLDMAEAVIIMCFFVGICWDDKK